MFFQIMSLKGDTIPLEAIILYKEVTVKAFEGRKGHDGISKFKELIIKYKA